MLYTLNMPNSKVMETARVSTALTAIGNRLQIADIKKLILDSGVCVLAIEMAQTGYRPIKDQATGKIVMEELSEAAHIEMVKFIANKVLPPAKEYETIDDKKAHDKWAGVIREVEAKGKG